MSYFCRRIIFAEGERWVQRYILEHSDEFKGCTLTFESRLDAGETVRRVDVVVSFGEDMIYYEFKSVKNLPPSNFAKQFLKDLEIADNLDQIKWYFDGSKISRLDKEVFLRELEKVEINRKIIVKWVTLKEQQTKEGFINFINKNFDLIFQIK